MPTEMKNRPSRMSRNGRMTLSTWWLYSVSASIIPARKAPSATEKPAAWARTARANAKPEAATTIVSPRRSRTTPRARRGTRKSPPTRRIPRKSPRRPIVPHRRSAETLPPATTAVRPASRAMTTRSSKTRMPKARVATSSRTRSSSKVLATTMVEETENAEAAKTAPRPW